MPDAGQGATSPREPGWLHRLLIRGPRRLLEILLHPLRRRIARRRLREAGPVRRVVFVCMGNICRSPFAARYLERELASDRGGGIRIESAGFIRPGRPSPPEAIRTAARFGVDLTGHTSRLVEETDPCAGRSLVFVMSTGQRERLQRAHPECAGSVLVLGDLDPGPIRRRTVMDPIERSEEVYSRVYGRIARCVEEVAAHAPS